MSPLRYVVLGLALVFLDLRIGSFDLVPDPIGWGLIVFGLGPLAPRERMLVTARSLAAAGLVASVILIFVTGFLEVLVDDAVQVAFVFTFCTALMRTVAEDGLRGSLNRVRWLALGFTVGSVALFALGLGPLATLRADGGATAAGLLMQDQADLLARTVEVTDVAEVSALGAAKLGWQALGAGSAWIEPVATRRYHPRATVPSRQERRSTWRAEVARARFDPLVDPPSNPSETGALS